LAARARSTLEAAATALLTRGFSLTNSQDRRLLKVSSAFSQQASSCLHTQASTLEQGVLRLRLNASSLISHLHHALRHRLALMLRGLSSSISGSLKALDQNETGLKIMTPQLTLRRGYSITFGKDGKALRDANDAAMDDRIRTMLAQGTIYSVICDKEP
jgi:exonuclease VII large subunit